MDEELALREMISRILTLPPGDGALVAAKIEICRKYSLPAVPKNSAILAVARPEEREALRKILLVKPSRTLSGVAPVAVMTTRSTPRRATPGRSPQRNGPANTDTTRSGRCTPGWSSSRPSATAWTRWS